MGNLGVAQASARSVRSSVRTWPSWWHGSSAGNVAEQIRTNTADNPSAVAFLFLTDRLGITGQPSLGVADRRSIRPL